MTFLLVLAVAATIGSADHSVSSPATPSIIECNGQTIGEPCDLDDTLCTREICVETGPGNVACLPDTPEKAPDGTLCESDGIPCTLDQCMDGSCVHADLGEDALCTDGDACTVGTRCDASGECVGGSAIDCDDGNACTTDSCDPTLGCQADPDVGASCDDDLFCTSDDRCDGAGACVGNGATCVDGNTCTIDSCDEDDDSCQNTVSDGAPCSDGDSCSVDDACNATGECIGTQLDDGSTCTASGGCLIAGVCGPDGCTSATPIADGEMCTDGDSCTLDDLCTTGECGGRSRSCFDDDSCTSDLCHPIDGCVFEEIEGCRASLPDAGGDVTLSDAGGFPDPDAGTPGARLGGGGCGCNTSVAGWPGAALLVLIALVPLWRRRLLLVLLVGVGGAVGGMGSAAADGLDADIFAAAPTGNAILSLGDGRLLPGGDLHIAALFDVATDVLVFRDPDTGEALDDGEVISRRSTLQLAAGVGLFGRFEIGAVVPIAVAQSGDLTPLGGEVMEPGSSLGDLRLVGRGRIYGTAAFDLVGELALRLPTGQESELAGEDGVGVTPRLIAGVGSGRLRATLQAGYRVRSNSTIGELTVGDELTGGAGVAFALIPTRLWALGEAYASVGVQGDGVQEERPAEGVLGARARVAGPWHATAGVGIGLSHGYGSPGVRGIVGVSYAPRRDPSPPPPAPIIEPVVVAQPEPLPPPLDSDGDGIFDPDDGCPEEPEDEDGFEDDDGCPDPDNDGDKILDADDQCPLEAEVVNGIDDQDGCPDEGLIVMVEDRIVLDERVLFDLMRARVKRRGRPTLQAIVDLYEQHPEWKAMVIEGHADSTGTTEYNQWLSEKRANRVREALIKMGMRADEVTAVGYGESRPRVEGESEEARQKNRRVEFVIITTHEEVKEIEPGEDGTLDVTDREDAPPSGGDAEVSPER